MVLFVLAKVADIEVEDAVRGTMPFMIPLLAVLALLVFVPEFSLWLPTLIYR
jgi:TRAP-type C4-dicarboxylate transport system permease large subunit